MKTIGFIFWNIYALCYPVQDSGWKLLEKVEIIMGYDSFLGTEAEKPQFSAELITKNGTIISLEGFMIPIQEKKEQDYFILSRYPYQSCFFCGAAGPETVVEVYSSDKLKYTEERIRVKGQLRLNKNNPLHLFYLLENSQIEKLE